MSLINKLTKDLINKIIIEFKSPENRDKINEEIIHPTMFYISDYITKQLYPFFLIGTSIFVLTFIFAFTILILIIKLNFKK